MKNIKYIFMSFLLVISAFFVVSCGASKTIEYNVEHYQENIDNNEYSLHETETLKGKSGSKTKAEYKNYAGFTNGVMISQKKLAKKEDNTIKLYYSRNSYSFIASSEDDSKGSVSESAGSYKFRTNLTINATPAGGYAFAGWYDGDIKISDDSKYSFVMPNKNTSYTAKFELDVNLDKFEYELKDGDCILKGIKDKTAKNIVIPQSITKIDQGALKGCSSVESLTLPFFGAENKEYGKGIIYPLGYIFGTEEFEGATRTTQRYRETYVTEDSYSSSLRVKDYYIPNSLKNVTIDGAHVFASLALCNMNIESLTIKNVEKIDTEALNNATLNELYFNGTLAEFVKVDFEQHCLFDDSYNLYYKDHDNNYVQFSNELVVPDDVEGFSKRSFAYYIELETLEFGTNIKYSDEDAFEYCNNLKNVYFDGTLKDWAQIEFANGGDLISITEKLYLLDNNGDVSFNGNKYKLISNSLDLSGLKRIGSYAFSGFADLNSVLLSDGLEIIGESAFEKTGIKEIYIPTSVKKIGNDAFYRCNELTSVYYDGTIDDWAQIEFDYDGNPISYAKNLYLLDENGNVSYNGKNYKLVSGDIVLTNAKKVEAYVFDRYDKITSIVLPSSLEFIGECAFAGTNIEEITIPASVNKIDEYAFEDSNIKRIHNLSNVNINSTNFELPNDCIVD